MMKPEHLKMILILLYEIQYSITPTHFRELFGDNSTYLWSKFTKRANLLEFYANLDSEKKDAMLNYLKNYNHLFSCAS